MARIRSIKPEFWTDAAISKVSKEAALFFIAMWTFADDDGVIKNDTRALSLSVPTYRPQSIQGILRCLWKEGLIVLSEDSQLWLIVGWRHQRIDKRYPGKFNINEIKWITHSDAQTIRGSPPTIPRKERRGEEREERICSSRTLAASSERNSAIANSFQTLTDEFYSDWFKNLKPTVVHAWSETFKDPEWIKLEIKKAKTWVIANPAKAPKSNIARFLTSWLNRAWEYHRKTIKSEPMKSDWTTLLTEEEKNDLRAV